MTGMRLRHVAPAGAPIGVIDVVRWLGTLATDASSIDTLCRTIATRAGVSYCRATCTGRAAMTLILRALKRAGSEGRDEVIVPAYTCYSVAASVVRAGLKPRIVDVSLATLDYEWPQLDAVDTGRTLAVIGTNLYGMPNDMPRLAAFSRERRLFLVDDAAQALGASVGGRLSGTWGDVGIYSLDKGKNVSAMDGGLILSSNETVVRALEKEVSALPRPKRRRHPPCLVQVRCVCGDVAAVAVLDSERDSAARSWPDRVRHDLRRRGLQPAAGRARGDDAAPPRRVHGGAPFERGVAARQPEWRSRGGVGASRTSRASRSTCGFRFWWQIPDFDASFSTS